MYSQFRAITASLFDDFAETDYESSCVTCNLLYDVPDIGLYQRKDSSVSSIGSARGVRGDGYFYCYGNARGDGNGMPLSRN